MGSCSSKVDTFESVYDPEEQTLSYQQQCEPMTTKITRRKSCITIQNKVDDRTNEMMTYFGNEHNT